MHLQEKSEFGDEMEIIYLQIFWYLEKHVKRESLKAYKHGRIHVPTLKKSSREKVGIAAHNMLRGKAKN